MRLLAVLVVSLFFMQCGGAHTVRSENAGEGIAPEELARQELFDPADLPSVFVIPPPDFRPAVKVEAAEITGSTELTQPDSVLIDSTKAVPGYRIQISSTTSYVRANEWLLNAQASILDESVNLTYDAPYYKVRVGNFIYREDAERFLEEELKAMYPDAWIIRTFVYPFETSTFTLISDSLIYDSLNVTTDTTEVTIDTTGSVY
ncbi:SPOR domain-containing protein [candidate division KSB1 bacterium]